MARSTQIVASSPVEVGKRFSYALAGSGLSAGQLARMVKLPRARIEEFVEGKYLMSMRTLCAIGLNILHADPRWLATGERSATAVAAIEAFKTARAKGMARCSAEDFDKLVEWLTASVQTDRGAGVCRYCGCTDEFGCGACEWLDEAATVCSQCLIVEE